MTTDTPSYGMFHWLDNMYFGRLPDGFVRVVKFSGAPHVQWWYNDQARTIPTEYPRADGDFRSVTVILDIRISSTSWASIVASVSKGGESNGRYYEALDFHAGKTRPTAENELAASRAENAELRAALRTLLDTREAEAKMSATWKIAIENYTDHDRNEAAYLRAMIASNKAEKTARALVAQGNKPT